MAFSFPAIGGDVILAKFKALGDYPGSINGDTWLEQSMNLAYEAASQDHSSVAVHIYGKCIPIAQNEWGSADINTLEFQRAKAQELFKLRKFKEADDNFQQILTLAEQRLKNPALTERAEFLKHVEDIAEARIELATALKNKSKFEDAATINNDNFKVCRRLLGANHRFTKKAQVNRDTCLEKKKEAEARKEQDRKASEEQAASSKQAQDKKDVSTGKTNSTALLPNQPTAHRGRAASQSVVSTPIVKISGPTQQTEQSTPEKGNDQQRHRLSLDSRTAAKAAKDLSKFAATNAANSKTGSLSPKPKEEPSQRSSSVGRISVNVSNLLGPEATSKDGELKRSRSQDLKRKSVSPKPTTPPTTSTPPKNDGSEKKDSNQKRGTGDRMDKELKKTETQKQNEAQLLGKQSTSTHPSDIWLGESLKDTHSLFVKRDENEFSSDPAFEEPKYSRRVRIAILDTGLDRNHPHIKRKLKRIPKMRAFIEEAKKSNDCSDVDGHGTHLAMLINKVAPEADIHIARVFKTSKGGSDAPVAEAIRHAVDQWDVDIICMSFGFRNSPKPIQQALIHAASKDKLMFAAATNDGGNVDEALFPAKHPNVFCIHATDSDGAWASFNTVSRDEDYSTLGIAVKSAAASRLSKPVNGTSEADSETAKPKLTERRDGTSVATAIAAGTAALFLEFARMPSLEGSFSIVREQEDVEYLHTFEGMKRVLDKVCLTDTRTNKFKYLAPWKLLSLSSDRSEPQRAAKNCWKKIEVHLLP